jgi:hypothetical protein
MQVNYNKESESTTIVVDESDLILIKKSLFDRKIFLMKLNRQEPNARYQEQMDRIDNMINQLNSKENN